MYILGYIPRGIINFKQGINQEICSFIYIRVVLLIEIVIQLYGDPIQDRPTISDCLSF